MGDVLAVEPAAALSLTIEGPFAQGLDGEADNLVLRAARALDTKGAKLTLTKNLPVASGIGGGSADAAAALRGLNQLWNLDKDEAALHDLAAGLGSDIPACVLSASCFMEGRGEVLRAAEAMPRMPMLLVNPGVEMALPRGHFTDTADLLRFLETTRNDLEEPARQIQPVIGDVLKAIARLPGALMTRMSGSGATCFGIFADDDCCRRAAESLRTRQPGWWVMPTFVPENGTVREPAGQDIGPTPEGL
jgi:4-diphosphocytidyl-2-C-methyl-D-erythritol kinase